MGDVRRVLIVRHAEAEDTSASGRDEDRHLTARGQERMEAAVRGLTRVQKHLDIIACSPLVRAVETAEILGRAYRAAHRTQHRSLRPDADPGALLRWLTGHEGDIALVGHEPVLSAWVGFAVTGTPRAIIEMKKGSVCALELAKGAAAGEGRILWAMTWRQLKAVRSD